MIVQWEDGYISLTVLSVARVSFPAMMEFSSRVFSLTDHTRPSRPEPMWQKMAQSSLDRTTQLVVIEEESRSPTMDRRWLK